jgi:hypothetical protein
MSNALERAKKEKQAELDRNAEYQRRKTQMTADDRAQQARDIVAKNIHEQNVRDGKNSTFEQAHNQATAIANKVHRERQEKGER